MNDKSVCVISSVFFLLTLSLLLFYFSSAFHINYGKSSRDASNLCVCVFSLFSFFFQRNSKYLQSTSLSYKFPLLKFLYLYKCHEVFTSFNSFLCCWFMHFNWQCFFFISLFQLQILDLCVCTWAGHHESNVEHIYIGSNCMADKMW